MRSWFGATGKARRGGSLDDADETTKSNLQKAQGLFNQMRVAVSQDMDALNEATRLVHEIDASVMKMTSGDTRAIWKAQVEELQRELQMVTARMLSIEPTATSEPPAQPPAAEPADSLFAGLDLGGGDSLFSGLDLGGGEDVEQAAATHASETPPIPLAAPILDSPSLPPDHQPPTSSSTGGPLSGPLDLALFADDDLVIDNAPLPQLDLTPRTSLPPTSPSSAPHSPLTSLVDMLGASSIPHSIPDSIPDSIPHSASIPHSTSSSVVASPVQQQAGEEERMGQEMEEKQPAVGNTHPTPPARKRMAATIGHRRRAEEHAQQQQQQQQVVDAAPTTPEELMLSTSIPTTASTTALSVASSAASAGPEPPHGGVQHPPLPSLDDTSPASPLALPAQLDHIHSNLHTQLESLEQRILAAHAPERAARARARALATQARELEQHIALLQTQQTAAAAADDFDNAAKLSAQLEAQRAQLNWVRRDARAAEDARHAAAEARATVQGERVGVMQQAIQLGEAAIARAGRAAQERGQARKKLLSELHDAAAAAAEHLAELQGRVAAKEEGIAAQRAALQKKIDVSTASMHVQREQATAMVDDISAQLDTLRAALAAKEAELLDAQAALAQVDERIAAAEGKYDKSKTMLQEDQAALEADAARLAAEEASLEQLRARCAREEEEAARVGKEGQEAVVEGEQSIASLRATLDAATERAAQEAARRGRVYEAMTVERGALEHLTALQSSKQSMQQQCKALCVQRRGAATEARKARERVDAAARLLPELERDKRAAAGAGDFAEAKRLAEEIKAAEREVQEGGGVVARETGRVGELGAEEGVLMGRVEEVDNEIAAAVEGVQEATRARLKAQEEDVRAQLQEAQQEGNEEETAEWAEELQGIVKELEGDAGEEMNKAGGGDTSAAGFGEEEETPITLPTQLFSQGGLEEGCLMGGLLEGLAIAGEEVG